MCDRKGPGSFGTNMGFLILILQNIMQIWLFFYTELDKTNWVYLMWFLGRITTFYLKLSCLCSKLIVCVLTWGSLTNNVEIHKVNNHTYQWTNTLCVRYWRERRNVIFTEEKPWNFSMYRLGTMAWDTAQGESPAALAVKGWRECLWAARNIWYVI